MAKIPTIRTITGDDGNSYALKFSRERNTFFAVVNGRDVKYPKTDMMIVTEEQAIAWIQSMANPVNQPTTKEVVMNKESEAVVLNDKQQEAFDLIVNGVGNVLLTGNAGTGKSFVITQAIKALVKKGVRIQICASTGLAATAIGGKTFHSAFRIYPKTVYDFNNKKVGIEELIKATKYAFMKKSKSVQRSRDMIRYLDMIIIDEVSMVHIFDLIRLDEQLRFVRNNDKPFGGIRMVFVGDFLQLEPVHNNRLSPVNLPDSLSAFCYESKRSWKNASITTVQLTKIVRQQDEYFATFLNNVRCGIWQPWMQEVIDKCKERQIPETGVPFFSSKNEEVNAINEAEMAKLETESHIFEALDRKDKYVNGEWVADTEYWDKNCLALKKLELKVGAQVICLVNQPRVLYVTPDNSDIVSSVSDFARGLVNGDIGIVINVIEKYGMKYPIIEWTRSGNTYAMIDHTFSQGADNEYRKQIPVKPCWALTIHKAQGMTLHAAVVNVADAFATGQVYVALSRVRTLDGLYITGFDRSKIKAHEKSLAFYGIKGNYEGDEQQGPGEGNQGAKPIQPIKPNNGGNQVKDPIVSKDSTKPQEKIIINPQTKEKEKQVTVPTSEQIREAVRLEREEEIDYLMLGGDSLMNGGTMNIHEQIHAMKMDKTRVITNVGLGTDEAKKGYDIYHAGAYTFAFLDHFFKDKPYRVDIRKHENKNTIHETAMNDNVVIRWSNADQQYNLMIGTGEGWLGELKKIGLIVGNSKKMSKRLQELVRQTAAYKYFDTLKIEVMDPAVLGVDEKFVDGISAISMSFAVSLYENNKTATRDWIERNVRAIQTGKTTVVSLRVLTPKGLIKGNALILPDKMMNGYDIRTFTPNVKSELSTTGWFWSTIEPSFGRMPLKSDDLTIAIYHRIAGIVDPKLMIDTFRAVTTDQVDKIVNGDPNDWMKDYRKFSEIDPDNMNMSDGASRLDRIDQLVEKMEEIGLSIESSQLLMYLKANAFAMSYGIVDRNSKKVDIGESYKQPNGTWMPVPYAYRAHIMTREALEIFGFKFKNKNYEGFFHEQSHCFVVPGDFFVANYINHGGYDLDDTVNVIIRQFTMSDGSNTLCAFLLRNPNDFAEWSEIPVSPKEVKYCYHQIGDIPMVSWEELNTKVPKLSDLLAAGAINYEYDVLPGASTIELSVQYDMDDEIRNRTAARLMPGGTGATVLPKILHYAIVGTYLEDQIVSNEQLIDAVQQGMATPLDIEIIKAGSKKIYADIKKWLDAQKPMHLFDAYWADTRIPYPVNKEHGFWDAAFGKYSYVQTNEKSLLINLFRDRETIAREGHAVLLEWANNPHAPSKLMNFHDPMIVNPAYDLNKIMAQYSAITEKGVIKDWASFFVAKLEESDRTKGEDYTDTKMLMLWRQAFEMKRVRPKANWDKWLFVVDPTLDKLPIDWLIRAYNRI